MWECYLQEVLLLDLEKQLFKHKIIKTKAKELQSFVDCQNVNFVRNKQSFQFIFSQVDEDL